VFPHECSVCIKQPTMQLDKASICKELPTLGSLVTLK